MKVTAEKFIKIWQHAKSPAEVAKKTGLTMYAVNGRAYNLRKKGVKKLKRFPGGPRGRPIDYVALNELAGKELEK